MPFQTLIWLKKKKFNSGNIYGGDGTINFALPDLRGRMIVKSSENYTLGMKGGSEVETITNSQMPSHNHQFLSFDGSPDHDTPGIFYFF